jgi:hypothetical protein
MRILTGRGRARPAAGRGRPGQALGWRPEPPPEAGSRPVRVTILRAEVSPFGRANSITVHRQSSNLENAVVLVSKLLGIGDYDANHQKNFTRTTGGGR